MTSPPVVLTVAGTDSGGAAGARGRSRDDRTPGCHGACVVTAVTAQDTTGVRAVHQVPLGIVDAQIGAVLDDLPVAAVKTGMLGSPGVVALVADAARVTCRSWSTRSWSPPAAPSSVTVPSSTAYRERVAAACRRS